MSLSRQKSHCAGLIRQVQSHFRLHFPTPALHVYSVRLRRAISLSTWMAKGARRRHYRSLSWKALDAEREKELKVEENGGAVH